MGDTELIERIKCGDRDSSDAIIERYYAPILRYCLRHCADMGRAEDMTQETFLRVFRDIAAYRNSGSFRSYVYTIAHHLCVDESRRVRADELSEDMPAPDSGFSRIDDRDQVSRLLGTLPEKQREALILRYGEQLSFKEIGDVTGASPRTVQSRVRLALASLRKEKL